VCGGTRGERGLDRQYQLRREALSRLRLAHPDDEWDGIERERWTHHEMVWAATAERAAYYAEHVWDVDWVDREACETDLVEYEIREALIHIAPPPVRVNTVPAARYPLICEARY